MGFRLRALESGRQILLLRKAEPAWAASRKATNRSVGSKASRSRAGAVLSTGTGVASRGFVGFGIAADGRWHCRRWVLVLLPVGSSRDWWRGG